MERLGLAKWMESDTYATTYKPLLADWGKTLWALWTAYKLEAEGNFYITLPESVLNMPCFQPWKPPQPPSSGGATPTDDADDADE